MVIWAGSWTSGKLIANAADPKLKFKPLPNGQLPAAWMTLSS